MTTRGRGTGRGLQPPRVIEDRDVLGYANKRVATSGPPSVQTFYKPPVVSRGRGRGGPPIPRGIGFQRGGPSLARGRGRGVGSSFDVSSSRGRGVGGNGTSSSSSSSSRPRVGEADTYRPRYTSPPAPRYPINRRQSDEADWGEYRELQRDRERYMGDRSSSSPPSRATRSRNGIRRYSPSQPTLEETWSSKYPSQNNENRSHHAGPSKSSSNVPIDLSQDDSSPPLPQNPRFDNPPPNPSSNSHTNGHTTRQHVIFNSSSPSLPPEQPKEPRLDPAFKRQPPAGPSSNRLSSPSIPHIRQNPTPNPEHLPSSTSTNKGKGSAASTNPPILQVPRIPEPPAVPVEVKKMTFRPNNPNNPNPKPKDKDKDKDPKESEKDKGKGKEKQSEPEPKPGPVRVKAEPDIQVEIPQTTQQEAIIEEPVDVKPHIKELENEVEHTSGGIRRSGTMAFTKEELPDCWAKNSTERSKARMAFRKSQREEMLSQGKKIGGTHWRDDGVAFDWTLPDTAIPKKDLVASAPTPQVQRTSTAAIQTADSNETTRPSSTSASNTAVPPTNIAPKNPIPTESKSVQIKAPTPSTSPSHPIASTSSNAIASASRLPNTSAAGQGTSSAPLSKDVKPASTKPPAAATTVTSESSRDTVKSDSNFGDQVNNNGEQIGNKHSERRSMPYPEQFDTLRKRRDKPEEYKKWKSEFMKSLSEPDSEGNPTKGCSFRERNYEPNFWITIYPTVKRTINATGKSKLPNTWKSEEFHYFEIFPYPDFDMQDVQPNQSPVNEWANKVADIVSKPDEKGRPTRWYKIIRIDYARELVIYSKDQPIEVIKSYNGPPIIVDTGIISSLIRNEQPVVAGHTLKKIRKENMDSKSEISSGTIATPSSKPNSSRSKSSKTEISAEESMLNQSTPSTSVNTSQNASFDEGSTQKRKKKSEKRALEGGSEDGHANGLPKSQVDVSPTRSDKPQKKAKKRHNTLENGSSASASGSSSIPVTSVSRSEAVPSNTAKTSSSSAQPPSSKTKTMQPPSTPGNANPSSSSGQPAPTLIQTRAPPASSPLPPPAPIPNTTANAAAITSTSDPVKEEIKPTLQPQATSEKLEELNSSLRTKVNEIEKWTRLSNEFPDLKLALDNQIGKTREEIFGLYDDIALEKERIKLGS